MCENEKKHNRNRAQVRWQHDSDDEPHTMKRQPELVSALAEAKQVQEIIGDYHEDRRTASWMWNDETHQRQVQISASCYHEPRCVVAKSRCEESYCRRFEKVGESTSAAEQTALEIGMTEPQHENVSINIITARSVQKGPLDAQQNSTLGAHGVNPSAGHTHFVTEHRC